MVGSKGTEHMYLGMDLKFQSQQLQVSKIPYLQDIVNEFQHELDKITSTPAALHWFEVSEDAKLLDRNQRNIFHHTVAKVLWAAIRARSDLLTALLFLTGRVKEPDEDDLKKLILMVSYIKGTINLPRTLSSNKSNVVKWWVDALFASRSMM
jgi:hypothetical protein